MAASAFSLSSILDIMARQTNTFGTFTLNQSTDKLEFILQLTDAITVTRLGFRVSTITGTTANYKISLQGVSSGVSDGSILGTGGGTPASATFNPASLGWTANTWKWVTLDNSYTCTRSQIVSIVIEPVSGVDASNNVAFTSGVSLPNAGFPYSIHNDAGTRARQTTRFPIVGWGSSTTAYGWPLETITDQNLNNTSTPDEYAMSFAPDAAYGLTYQIDRVRYAGSLNSASAAVNVKLYSGTTALQSFAGATGAAANTTGTNGTHDYGFTDTTLATLDFGSTYRIGIAPANANNCRVIILGCAATADWAAWPNMSQFGYSTRTDAGAWTDDNTKRLLAVPVTSDWTEVSGGATGGYVIGG